MTDWRRSFRADFFNEWRAAGLPDPDEAGYERLRGAGDAPEVPPAVASGPLHPATIRSIYGFGHVVGTLCTDLLCVESEASASWCGRFNLGISLVDWLCDEAAVSPGAIAALPAFASLTISNGHVPSDHAAAVFLDGLAGELLTELARDVGPPRAGEPRGALWPTLRRMLRAELTLAEPVRATTTDLTALRLKSVEPFRIMAERTVASAPERVLVARRLGRAIGECVWLVDDADDLWRDLGARHANRFCAAAVAADPRVVASDDATLVDLAVVRVLRREQTAAWLSRRAVGRLAAALRQTPCEPGVQLRAAALIGAALARWAD